jgi:hypothetical protein
MTWFKKDEDIAGVTFHDLSEIGAHIGRIIQKSTLFV